MSTVEDFHDPGTVVLTIALEAGGSILEKQDIHSQDDVWQDEHSHVLDRENSHGSVDILSAEDLPTFYTSFRLAPMTILMALAGGLYGPIHTEFLKSRVCEVALNISVNICANINELEYKALGDKVVKETSQYQLYISLVGSLPPVILSLFVGSWSDMFGRKLPMLFPFIGYFLSMIYVSVISNFILSPNYLLLSPIISSLTGGWTILLMAKFSYIGDYTTDQNRAMNIAVIDGFMILCSNLGGLLGGYLYQLYGMQIVFYSCTGMYGACFFYVLFIIRDRIPRGKHPGQGCSELFSTRHLKENLRTITKKRTGDTRTHIFIILGCLLIYSTCTIGDASVTQLFLEFQPFKWSVQFYTLFNCISGLFSSVSLITAMFIFRRFFGISDALSTFLSVLSGIMYFFGYGIADVDWIIYAATGLGFLRHLVIPCIRSLLSGMVEPNEIGKIMSLIASLQALTPLFGSAIFTSIFAQTSNWYPGLCFTIAAFLTVPVMGAFGYVDIIRRREIYCGDSFPVKSKNGF